MKRCSNPICRWLLCGLFSCCLGLGAATASATSHDKEKAAAKGTAAQDQAMAEMMKYAMPGPQHELLKPMAGKWIVKNKMWSSPGEPQITEGTCETAWILGGRYLQSTYRSQWMGEPFEGMGLVGYDVKAQKFVNLWLDTMSTTYMASTGTMDASGKVLTYVGSYADPVSGKDVPFRMVTKIVDPNQHIFAMYSTKEGKESQDMEITYTRAQ